MSTILEWYQPWALASGVLVLMAAGIASSYLLWLGRLKQRMEERRKLSWMCGAGTLLSAFNYLLRERRESAAHKDGVPVPADMREAMSILSKSLGLVEQAQFHGEFPERMEGTR